ncbi:hypothetical protein EDC04DRAFT_2912182 [Pisolithus marmoratus]|nr:hypothetical protein EDC04DRAFT_2912182 [Pisolithus marmoratus]
MSPKKRKKLADPVEADTNAKRGACSACRSRKVRCDFAPSAIACRKCIERGHPEDCIIQESRTRSCGNSTPPLGLSQPVAPGRNRRGSRSQIQQSMSTTRGSDSEPVCQSRPPPSIGSSTQSGKRQRSSSSFHEPGGSTVNLTSVPEVDESQSDHFEPLPLPLPKFYDHFAMSFPEDNRIDDAGTDDTNSDAKEFLSGYIHHQDDNELELSGVESNGEDHENEDEESSDDGLLATIQQQLPSTKLRAKRVPAQKTQRTKSSGKGNQRSSEAMLPTSSDDRNHPKTCIFKIQCCIQRSQGSKVSSIPFAILSSITLEGLCEMVAEKLNRHARHIQLQYRLDSDKAKTLFTSIQSEEELDMFKDRMRPLIMPQYLPSGHLSTRLLKPVHVIFEDSGNDSIVERPAHTSTTNSHKTRAKGTTQNVAGSSLKQTRRSSNELDGADEQQDCIEALHERYRCNTHSKGPESPVYCYRAKNSTDCYALTHNHIATWALQIMRKTATVDEKPLTLLSLTKRSKSNGELEAAGHTTQPMPAATPAPAPYAYPPPPVIVVPPAAPWGMQHGYPGYPPMPLGSLPPPHMSTGRMSHPTTPSLPAADLPNEDLPQAPEMVSFPDIIRWFSFLDERLRRDPHADVTVNFSAFGPVLRAKGFLNIAQLSRDYAPVETLQAWLGVEVGTALVIRSYVDMDLQAVKVGKRVLPLDN